MDPWAILPLDVLAYLAALTAAESEIMPMGKRKNWIKIDPETVPAEQREKTRFFNEAVEKVAEAANGAADADREDVVMMSIEVECRQEDRQPKFDRCKGTANNIVKQCRKCRTGQQHKFAGFVPQDSLHVVGDDTVFSLAECKSPWVGYVPPRLPHYYVTRREANASFGRRLDALPDGLREVAAVIDATHDAYPTPTNREKAEMLTRLTGELWTERRYRRVFGYLKRFLLGRYPEKLRRISSRRGQLRCRNSIVIMEGVNEEGKDSRP